MEYLLRGRNSGLLLCHPQRATGLSVGFLVVFDGNGSSSDFPGRTLASAPARNPDSDVNLVGGNNLQAALSVDASCWVSAKNDLSEPAKLPSPERRKEILRDMISCGVLRMRKQKPAGNTATTNKDWIYAKT